MRAGVTAYLKGFAMGSADVVPGVSGATIALIVGVYDRMLAAITAIDPRILGILPKVHRREARRQFRSELVAMDLPFLLSLGFGAISAVILLANAMHYLTDAHPVPTYGFFTGLIAASAIVLYGEVDVTTTRRIAIALAGVVLAALVTGVTESGFPHVLPIVFVAGAVAICAMVLPGVSGSFLLLVLGQYEYMTGALSDVTNGLAGVLGGDSPAVLVESGTVVAVFVTGAVLGLFTMAHIVKRALDRYRAATMTFLVSLMVGALRLPLVRVTDNLGQTATNSLAAAVIATAFGAGLVLLADRYAVSRPAFSNPA